MPSAISRPVRNRRNRRDNNEVNRPQPTTPIKATGAAVASAVLTVTFDQTVSLNGVPQYDVGIASASPLSAVLASPTSVAVTYSTSIAAAADVSIPYEEPAVRNSSGGFVATSSLALA